MSAACLLAAVLLGPIDNGLDARQQQDLEAACRAYQQGSPLMVLKHLGPLLARSEATVNAIEDEFQRRRLPYLGEVLAHCHLGLVQQGLEQSLPKPSPTEIALMLPAVKWYVDGALISVEDQAVMADPLPRPLSMQEFAETLAEAETVHQQLADVRRSARYAQKLGRRLSRAAQAELVVDPDQILESVERLQRDLDERHVELAVNRLALGVEILKQPEVSPDHVLAAANWQADYRRANEFFKASRRRPPQREALRDADLPKTVNLHRRQAEKLAGDLTAKARLLDEALHWWLRGRYGAGPEANGLVKSAAAVKSSKAQMQLFMPSGDLNPTDPFAPVAYAAPVYQRRHHDWWSWNDRGVYQDYQTSHRSILLGRETEQRYVYNHCSGDHHWTTVTLSETTYNESSSYAVRKIVDQDDQTLTRLVGYLEYGAALQRFDELLRHSTPEEIEVFDQLVQRDHRFDIYTNLSRNFPQAAASAFVELPQNNRPVADFKQQGLPWVMALARVELAAMVAGFTRHSSPFGRVPPGRYEAQAYEELLVDGMRTHVWALQRDPLAQPDRLRQAGGRDTNVALAYHRRVGLVRSFTEAVRRWLGARMTPAQRQELDANRAWLGEMMLTLEADVLQLGEEQRVEGRVTTRRTGQ